VGWIARLGATAKLTAGNRADGMRLFGKGRTMLAPSTGECGIV